MKTEQYKNTSLLTVNKGDKVLYRDRILTVIDYELTPNGAVDAKLVCLIKAKDNVSTIEATSDKFKAIPEEYYQERVYI